MAWLKKLIPKDNADLFAVFTALFLIILITSYELNTLYKIYEDESNESKQTKPSLNVLITLVVGLYILFNVLVNMFYAMSTDTTIESLTLPTILLEEWRYCSSCQLNSPPRSYHCFTCQKCILKRSNHCMFLGKCSGYKNFRYYYLLIIYSFLATVYCNVLNIEYVYDVMDSFSLKTLFITFMPLMARAVGFVDNIKLITVFVNTSCLFLSFVLFFYLIVNFKLISHGQTWHEHAKGIRTYNKSLNESVVEIFGTNWPLAIVWPFAKLKLIGDGAVFKKSGEVIKYESVKSL